jgi:hypothetical protein
MPQSVHPLIEARRDQMFPVLEPAESEQRALMSNCWRPSTAWIYRRMTAHASMLPLKLCHLKIKVLPHTGCAHYRQSLGMDPREPRARSTTRPMVQPLPGDRYRALSTDAEPGLPARPHSAAPPSAGYRWEQSVTPCHAIDEWQLTALSCRCCRRRDAASVAPFRPLDLRDRREFGSS